MCIRDRCSSDNYFPENVFSQYEYEANIPGVLVPGQVTDWVMEVGTATRIVTYGETTCEDRYVALGQVYFDRAFSEKFVEKMCIRDRLYPFSSFSG